MAREHPDYRANLEILNIRYPDHDMLTVQETMQILGYCSKNTVMKYLGEKMVHGRISKAALARYMCG